MSREKSRKLMVGVDVQAITEVSASLDQFGSRYLRRVYTQREIDDCTGPTGLNVSSLASRFAAKEAVMKMLSVDQVIPTWRNIEIQRETNGSPSVELFDNAALAARLCGVNDIAMSMSHDGGVAVATAIGTRNPEEVLQ